MPNRSKTLLAAPATLVLMVLLLLIGSPSSQAAPLNVVGFGLIPSLGTVAVDWEPSVDIEPLSLRVSNTSATDSFGALVDPVFIDICDSPPTYPKYGACRSNGYFGHASGENSFPPGTYYVRVSSIDHSCTSCGVEMSNIASYTVKPPEVALGIPKPSIRSPRRQAINKLQVIVILKEPGKVEVYGSVKVPGRTYSLKDVNIANAAAGVPLKLKLKLTRGARRAIKRSMRKGSRATAKFTVYVDSANYTGLHDRRVVLRRR